MALKIRMRQQGRTNRAFYRVVLTDSRSPRDGAYLEALGWYNPVESDEDKVLYLNAEKIQHWLSLGAQMTENVEALVKRALPAVARFKNEQESHRLAKARAKRAKRKKAQVKAGS